MPDPRRTRHRNDANNTMSKLTNDALKLVKDNHVIGLGSGRAATALVRSLAGMVRLNGYHIRAVPTSLQIKLVAEDEGISLMEADQLSHIDLVFDGADQIDAQRHVIKGGGGALLRENILFNLAKKVVVIADSTKFVEFFTRTVPVEIHPLARGSVMDSIQRMGGKPCVRTIDRGYPFFTENGNIVLDCDFGTITNPRALTRKIKQTAGVLESGIFLRKPDVIYKVCRGEKFEMV